MTSLTEQPAAKTITAKQATLPPLPAAAPGGPEGCPRPFVNERLNSRLSRALPEGEWKPAWSAAIDPAIMPLAVLASSKSVIAAGRRATQVFVGGKSTAHIVSAGEDAEIQLSAGTFLLADRYSRITAFDLTTGTPGASLSADGGNQTKRTFVHRRGNHTVVASADESRSPHNPVPNRLAYLEVFDADGNAVANRDATTGRLRVAMHNDFIVLARDGAIDFLDMTLTAQRRIAAAITPLGLSLDEAGRAYMVCEANHKQQFWMVTAAGEYAVLPMPAGSVAYQRPPIVGYDHRVYLLCQDRILTLDDAAKLDWQFASPGRVAGATVTTDGHLLAACGDTVVSLNAKGESKVLFRVAGEQFMASPILGAVGEVYALTDKRLHCFRAR